jgi:hypothetical protein
MPPILYVDATSGGLVLQILLSGFVGGIVVMKLFWSKLVSAIFPRRKPETDAPATTDAGEEPGARVS